MVRIERRRVQIKEGNAAVTEGSSRKIDRNVREGNSLTIQQGKKKGKKAGVLKNTDLCRFWRGETRPRENSAGKRLPHQTKEKKREMHTTLKKGRVCWVGGKSWAMGQMGKNRRKGENVLV